MSIGAWNIAMTSGAWEEWADPAHPTAPPSGLTWAKANTDVHKRMGITMGIVDHGYKYVWELNWKYITLAEVLVLKDWWELRHFKFTPNYLTTPSSSVFYNCYWTDKAFKPVPQRGCLYTLKATLEEV